MEPENEPVESDAAAEIADESEPDAPVEAVMETVAESSADATTDGEVDGPSVDELEGRLGDVEVAMGHLQAGELDDAEAAIASLDQRISSGSD